MVITTSHTDFYTSAAECQGAAGTVVAQVALVEVGVHVPGENNMHHFAFPRVNVQLCCMLFIFVTCQQPYEQANHLAVAVVPPPVDIRTICFSRRVLKDHQP